MAAYGEVKKLSSVKLWQTLVEKLTKKMGAAEKFEKKLAKKLLGSAGLTGGEV